MRGCTRAPWLAVCVRSEVISWACGLENPCEEVSVTHSSQWTFGYRAEPPLMGYTKAKTRRLQRYYFVAAVCTTADPMHRGFVVTWQGDCGSSRPIRGVASLVVGSRLGRCGRWALPGRGVRSLGLFVVSEVFGKDCLISSQCRRMQVPPGRCLRWPCGRLSQFGGLPREIPPGREHACPACLVALVLVSSRSPA